MKIIISSRAEKELRKISKIDQIAIIRKIRSIKDSSTILNEEKLSGYKNIFRVRIGQYRVVYRKSINEIYIILIGHRKDIYHLLKQLFG
ncbi:type II toxin-antitoxin system mRNA interferase toxin, RelE/StbE family [Candidatus Roizmanbacteria bacterium CG_4_10_14_0_8_um_filter_36_36]|uniref:Type II toxin-antitoxin system mRNA interferase toxin, RelE/StbE family n=2 Tax=Candidatus Roizmaniibacteriota TaxID=1752723 RepID=A0A2M7BXR1_9BACT|nr:MAG: type II toxin-antitoxin system mRNA interferase toxin, RelE/StbE family [Candidatus Roizmanbacteria bacterium CG03_land_8_20_14_0_80_35_26]PIY70630.1 MAG: type II toxin-antitoxin system mRNA interferase toxin, RelE/StbE family [Candidatus Roizmanbacteria bacterium CG_4_10_14_0_8_um_filter_36_36]PIZ66766.1 MAG: type II toxin-antitoxin system mRNA interferase toxin, RelE/StbE family [Candidatus Roizmanbacteria bacterium CG_4_10_14_0_2_um_filter_36_35]